MRLTACLLSGLLLFGCNGHGRGSEGKKPTNLDEALLYARLDYVDGGVSFDAYLGILDSLGRVNVDIGKRFLRDDEEFEHLLEKQVRRRDITVPGSPGDERRFRCHRPRQAFTALSDLRPGFACRTAPCTSRPHGEGAGCPGGAPQSLSRVRCEMIDWELGIVMFC